MKYPLIIVAALFGMAANAQDVSTANWMAQPVTVDGIPAEWPKPLNFYDSDTRLLFAISNDSTHVYLCFESKDEQTQRKIMRAGMKVELDIRGKGKRSATISFPLPPKEREDVEGNTDNATATSTTNSRQPLDEANRKEEQALMRQRFLTDNITMDVKGFAFTNGILPIKGKNITVAMNWDSTGSLFYEIAVPITELFSNGYNAQELAKEITLNVEINALPQPPGRNTERMTAAAPAGGGGGGFGGGGGGFGGRGMRGGGFGGGGGGFRGNNDRSGLYKTTTFKQKFVLGNAGGLPTTAK
jgi:hypothetical protein